MRFLAIDPGPEQSASVLMSDLMSDCKVLEFGIRPNAEVLETVERIGKYGGDGILGVQFLAIEEIRSYGMPVGREVFDTVRWTGRFQQAWRSPADVRWIGRKDVCVNLCGSAKAKDPNIRRALMDRFGGDGSIKKGGPLYGVAKDVWAALGVACTFLDFRKVGRI